MKLIVIYGAGMSGLVAAINLARKGYTVIVHDREPGYGGDPRYNTSTHTTPIDVAQASRYIGIDVSPAFHPLAACPFYLHDTKVQGPVAGVYTVERGNRPTSLDTLLYGEALRLGVVFRFNSPLEPAQIPDLPRGSIIACGLTTAAYEMLGLPRLRWYGWCSRGVSSRSNYSWIWLDECVTEYGYFSSANNYYFNLLFSIRPVTREGLAKYEEFMWRNEGIAHGNWDYLSGSVPVGSAGNPRLFHDGHILCGTIGGSMDPMFWFGILGALMSGKIAADAVTDPAGADKEFRRVNRYFRRAYGVKNRLWYRHIRPRVNLMERIVRMIGVPRLERFAAKRVRADRHISFSIPGYANLGSCWEPEER